MARILDVRFPGGQNSWQASPRFPQPLPHIQPADSKWLQPHIGGRNWSDPAHPWTCRRQRVCKAVWPLQSQWWSLFLPPPQILWQSAQRSSREPYSPSQPIPACIVSDVPSGAEKRVDISDHPLWSSPVMQSQLLMWCHPRSLPCHQIHPTIGVGSSPCPLQIARPGQPDRGRWCTSSEILHHIYPRHSQ